MASIPEDQLAKQLAKWNAFGNGVLERFPLSCLHLRFELVMKDPSYYAEAIGEFTGLSVPNPETLEQWFDPKLVGRKSL